MQFEQALAVAARAETELAVQKFRNLTLQQDIDPNLKAKALIAYSDKVTELRSQNPLVTFSSFKLHSLHTYNDRIAPLLGYFSRIQRGLRNFKVPRILRLDDENSDHHS